MKDIDRIGSLFEVKDFEAIARHFKDPASRPDVISNDTDAEIVSILAFTYFNLRDYQSSLRYGAMIVEYIERNRQMDLGRDLYESTLLIMIDSLRAMGSVLEAYLFCRKAGRNIRVEQRELSVRMDMLSNHLAKSTISKLNVILPILSVVAVILQTFFHVFSRSTYWVILGALMAIVLISIFWEKAVENWLSRVLARREKHG